MNQQRKELEWLKMDEVGVARLPLCEWCREEDGVLWCVCGGGGGVRVRE